MTPPHPSAADAPDPSAGGRDELARAVARLRLRVLAGVFLGETSKAAAWLVALGGACVLALRGLGHLPAGSFAPAFAPALLALPWGVARARALRLGPEAAAAWIDRETGGTGVVVAQLETPDPAWHAQLADRLRRAPDPPAVRLGPPAGRLLPAALFALAAATVEFPRAPESGPPVALFQSLLGQLESRLGLLESAVDLDPAAAAEMRGALDAISSRVADGSPEELFRALDGLDERLGAEARGARGAALGVLQALASGAGEGEGLADAFGRAAELLEESGLAREIGPELLARLGPELLAGRRAGDPEQLAGVAEWLRGALTERVEGLRLGGLLDGGPLEPPAAWKDLLSGFRSSATAPGEGGAAAPLWGEESDARRELFRPEPLAGDTRLDPGSSGEVGEAPEAPTVEPAGEAAGLVPLGPSAGTAVEHRRLAPRHRRAVQAYFRTGDAPAGSPSPEPAD